MINKYTNRSNYIHKKKKNKIAYSSLLCSRMRLAGKAVNLGFSGGYRVARLWFPEHGTTASGDLAGHMLTAPLRCFQPLNYSHKNQELY